MINKLIALREMHDFIVSYQEDLWKADEDLLDDYEKLLNLYNKTWDEAKLRYSLTDEQLSAALDMEDDCE